MDKRTPGPWVVGYGTGLTGPTTPTFAPVCGGNDWPYIPISKEKDTIAIVPAQEKIGSFCVIDDGTAEANAAFIVKACNMHDELVAICKLLLEDSKLNLEASGGCDHAVGICACGVISMIADAEELLKKAEEAK